MCKPPHLSLLLSPTPQPTQPSNSHPIGGKQATQSLLVRGFTTHRPRPGLCKPRHLCWSHPQTHLQPTTHPFPFKRCRVDSILPKIFLSMCIGGQTKLKDGLIALTAQCTELSGFFYTLFTRTFMCNGCGCGVPWLCHGCAQCT